MLAQPSVLARWLCSVAIIATLATPSLADEPTPSKKTQRKAVARRRADHRDQRLQRLEALLADLAETPPTPASGRYQFQSAGDKLVVLDTQTGHTRIVDFEATQPVQSVDVGHAWVVVTVLGNVSQPQRSDPPSASKSGK